MWCWLKSTRYGMETTLAFCIPESKVLLYFLFGRTKMLLVIPNELNINWININMYVITILMILNKQFVLFSTFYKISSASFWNWICKISFPRADKAVLDNWHEIKFCIFDCFFNKMSCNIIYAKMLCL